MKPVQLIHDTNLTKLAKGQCYLYIHIKSFAAFFESSTHQNNFGDLAGCVFVPKHNQDQRFHRNFADPIVPLFGGSIAVLLVDCSAMVSIAARQQADQVIRWVKETTEAVT